MTGQKVLIVNKMHPSILNMLGELGWGVDYLPEITRSEILDVLPEYAGLIIRSKTTVDHELISKGRRLKFVARAGAGIDQIDMAQLDQKNIILINAPEGNRGALGEHTVGLLLSLMHNINRSAGEVRNKIWKREANRGIELAGKTVGIYGYGFMGSAFAEKLTGFGCRVIAYDKYKENFDDNYVQEVTREHFEKETEILSIHVPLTSETRERFDLEYLSRYKKLKFLLNTSRGEVLHLQAVNQLLESGQLVGAGLDVLENEKLDALSEAELQEFEKLVRNPNVIITPHIAGWTHESYRKINEVIINKMIEKGLSTNLAQTSKN